MNPIVTEGYVLHRRHYRESSLLIEFFSKVKGRISLICRGIKRHKTQAYLLRSFVPLQITFLECDQLSVLTHVEAIEKAFSLQDDSLLAGLYLNELLYRLIDKQEPFLAIYALYERTLKSIAASTEFSFYIRQFEFYLLAALGYAIDLIKDVDQNVIQADKIYRFSPHEGLVPVVNPVRKNDIFEGSVIIKMQDWELDSIKKETKRLFSLALKPLLGDKPLMSLKLLNSKYALMEN